MTATLQRLEAVTLRIEDNFGAARDYRLRAESGVFVGRSANCGLQVNSHDLSDIHCRIGLDNGTLWVQDWMSANGTRLNGVAIDAQTEIRVGDVIQIGQTRITALMEHRSPSGGSDSPQSTYTHGIGDDDRSTAVDDTSSPQPQGAAVPSESRQCEDAASEFERVSSTDFDLSFEFEDEETYDRETVALLRAEIEALQTALAQVDAGSRSDRPQELNPGFGEGTSQDQADEVLLRMQELIEEANCSDERVSVLEDLLHAAEDTHRAEQEERNHLEAWVGEIEKRVSQREEEHAAEIDAMRERIEESHVAQLRLQKQLQDAAFSGGVPKQYEQSLENLQNRHLRLQEQFAESQKQCLTLERRLHELSGEQEEALREERTQMAQEQAKLARMRFELSKKLADVEELPKANSSADTETSQRIRALREHLLEIHEQERKAAREAPLATRLAKLWKRADYA